MTYSHTVYGRSAVQQELSSKVLKALDSESCRNQHELCILGDFLDSPVLESIGKQLGIKSFLLGELPAALFSVLPISLYYRYTNIGIGNERGSNAGNLVWERTGEDINHQWTKTQESVILLGEYIQKAIIKNTWHLSVLEPIYDVVILNIASTRLEATTYTHSCNFIKPWCKRCPKCCYVWLMFMVFFPREMVDKMFQGENLLDCGKRNTFTWTRFK